MKRKTVRLIMALIMLFAVLFSFVSTMGIVFGAADKLWLSFLLGFNCVIMITSAIILYNILTNKDRWKKVYEILQLRKILERKIEAFEKAKREMVRLQLDYTYKEAELKYNETLEKLDD